MGGSCRGGSDKRLFPEITLELFSFADDTMLGSAETGTMIGEDRGRSGQSSYWRAIPQYGRVWREPGDGDWSRAALPIMLVHDFENVAHQGLLTFVYRDDELVVVPEPDKDEPVVYGGYDEQARFVGYAIPAAGPGFQDTIKLLFGFDAERQRIVGMQVLESRETPGLGDKIFKDAAFVAEFRDLAVSPAVKVVPKGTDDSPNAVDGITGATISSKAVAKIVTAGAARWKDRLPATGFPAAAPGAPPVSAPDTAAPASTEAARPPSPGGN